MKIAIICPNYPPAHSEGGISHYTQKFSRELVKLGENVVIITGDGYCGGGADGAISILNFKGEWDRKTVKNIVDQLIALRVDIVNLQYSPVMYSYWFKLFWPYYSKKLTSTVSFHTLWGGSKINHMVALGLLGSAQGILVTNSEIMYLLKRYLPIFLKKCRFVRIGSNILPSQNKTVNRRLSEKFSLINDVPVLSYFGMSYPGKGMDLLLEATRKVVDDHKRDIRLLIIGGGISDSQDHIDTKKRKIRELGIESNVIWTGRIPADEVSGLFKLSRVVVLPFRSGVSDRRGSLLAALSHNKAVVTTSPVLNISLFKNGENMIWPESDDAASFAKTVIQVLDNNELRQRLETGSAELAKHFCWSKIAEQTRSYFIDLLQNNLNYKYKVH